MSERVSPSSGRFANIDALRGLAALLVVTAHTADVGIGLVSQPSSFDSRLVAAMNQADIGRAAVVAFFCVSGYLIPMTLRGERWPGVASFVVRRTTRVYPAFWVSLVVIGAMFWMLKGMVFSAAAYTAQATMLPSLFGGPFIGGHYWTLQVELLFYGFCAIAFLLGRSRSALALFVPSCVLFAGLVMLRVMAGPLQALAVPLDAEAFSLLVTTVIALGFMFWASALRLALAGKVGNATLRLAIYASGAIYGAVLPLAGLVAFLTDRPDLARMLLGNGLGVGLFLSMLAATRTPSILQPLGRWSYSIYLFHPVPLYLLAGVAAAGSPALPATAMPILAWIAVVAGATIAIAAASYRFVEAPFISLGHRLAARLEQSTAGEAVRAA